MTAQKAQIESLIQEIDEILDKTAPRLPWLMPNDAVKQRQVLEQTRRYLASLQAGQPQSAEVSFDLSAGPGRSEVAALLPQTPAQSAPPAPVRPVLLPEDKTSAPAQAEVVESAQQALQAMVQEMNYLRSNLLQPMRSDVDVLRQQRESLLQEVRQLEAQRQQYALPQQNQLLMEFLQAAFRQMQENLSTQVAQMMTTLPDQATSGALPESSPNLSPNLSLTSSDLMALSPAQRLEQIQRVQTQSDQLLLKLDSSLRIIFNSLQQNVQTYQDSLEQGLSRMHNLGQQGEAMFSALVTRLAEQLGREASTFLQSSIEPAIWEPALPLEKQEKQEKQSATVSATVPSERVTPANQTGSTQPESDISRLLDELNELDAAQPAPPTNPFASDAPRSDAESLNSLDLLDRELQQLDLDAISPEPFAIVDEDLTLFQEGPLDNFLSTDLTVLQDDSEPEVLEPIADQAIQNPADDASEVLDLLNQLDVEADNLLGSEPQSDAIDSDSLGNNPFTAVSAPAEPPLVASPDSLYEDEFYQSLFGDAQSSTAADGLIDSMEGELDGEFDNAPTATSAAENAALSAEAADLSIASPQTARIETDRPELLLSDAVQTDWFSSLGESDATPAVSENLTEELPIVEAPEFPQPVENVLLPTAELPSPLPIDLPRHPTHPTEAIEKPVSLEPAVVEPATNEKAENKAADLPVEDSENSAPVAEPAIETASSLLDLIPFPASADLPAVNGMMPEGTAEEQAFELAQPGEDLLAEEPSHPDVLLNLRLPADTLEQLSQDLSSLEGGDTSFTSEPASDFASENSAIADATDWMLPDSPPEPVSLTDFFDAPIASDDMVGQGVVGQGVVGQSEEPIEDLLADYPDPPPALPDSPITREELFAADLDSPAPSEDLFAAYPDVLARTSDGPIALSEEPNPDWDLFDFDAVAESPAEEATNAIASDASAPDSAELTRSNPSDSASDSNAFTLEGLESLFENLPSIDPPPLSDSTNEFLTAFQDSELPGSEFSLPELPDLTAIQPSREGSSPDQNMTQEDAEKKKLDASAFPGDSAVPDVASRQEQEPEEVLARLEAELQSAPESRFAAAAAAESASVTGTLGDLFDDLLQAPPAANEDAPAKEWYLGLDIGTTGISAVLLNRSTHQLHPIYWNRPTAADITRSTGEAATEPPIEKQFRLPLAVTLMAEEQDETANVLVRDFKPYLNLALPYESGATENEASRTEPVLSWSETLPISLMALRQALEALLTPLASNSLASSTACGAVDLDIADFVNAMHRLSGAIVSIPAGWSEAYRFNLREALLNARLIARPEQILFLEESIAAMLAAFAGSSQSGLKLPQGQTLHEIKWQGNTLILCAGATQTEMALVQLSLSSEGVPSASSPPPVTHTAFHLRTLAYAGTAIDQDIITQLLYPLLDETDPGWCDLEQIAFPAIGEPDSSKREAFQKRLRHTATGRSLLDMARTLKLNLQQQNRFIVQIGQKKTTFRRQDLTTKVLLPYVQRLNRELNGLLNQTQIPALAVRQVVCTGGTASLGAITRWLQQKLPNALILQDAYPWTRSDCIPTCSRVAYGLAALPLYPSALDAAKHQYSDFFLLLTLMREFPNRALTLEEVLELLQQKGIDAAACRSRILAILEGPLPANLIPTAAAMRLLTPESRQNPHYQAIGQAPLFHAEAYPDGKAYRIDRTQFTALGRYWELLLAHTHQPLIQPSGIELNVGDRSSF